MTDPDEQVPEDALLDQQPLEDTLLDRGVDDILDEGYSPPERQPATHRVGTTANEQREGETWAERLAQEVEEPDPYADTDAEHDEAWEGQDASGNDRAGRLVAPDEGAHEDDERDLYAEDVGVDGGGASAEEAAMHLVEDEE
jgi:hypothetical protein